MLRARAFSVVSRSPRKPESHCLPCDTAFTRLLSARRRNASCAWQHSVFVSQIRGSHHPDYDPDVVGDKVVKANRPTEELYNAIVKNDVRKVYAKIDEGADVNFVFGRAYQCPGRCCAVCSFAF